MRRSPINRLDKLTSGSIAFGIPPSSLSAKCYLCLNPLRGRLRSSSWIRHRKTWKCSVTYFNELQPFGRFTIGCASLFTGRNHQLRRLLSQTNPLPPSEWSLHSTSTSENHPTHHITNHIHVL
ncbi:MAG: hypothetical protein ACTS4X_01280 [Candidatus Hodgkinia cicadicola]